MYQEQCSLRFIHGFIFKYLTTCATIFTSLGMFRPTFTLVIKSWNHFILNPLPFIWQMIATLHCIIHLPSKKSLFFLQKIRNITKTYSFFANLWPVFIVFGFWCSLCLPPTVVIEAESFFPLGSLQATSNYFFLWGKQLWQ